MPRGVLQAKEAEVISIPEHAKDLAVWKFTYSDSEDSLGSAHN